MGGFFSPTGSDLQHSLSLLLKRVLLICVSHVFTVSDLAALSRTGIFLLHRKTTASPSLAMEPYAKFPLNLFL